MYLRKLKKKDAPLMLEWMHDENVVENMAADFMHMTLENCTEFIKNSSKEECRVLHRAICTDDDEYLGTVSLKNISVSDCNAEYAIIMRSKAMGTGAAAFATEEILRIAFEELKLHRVYLCVKSCNLRARKFYQKVGFKTEGTFAEHCHNKNGGFDDLIWLAILEREFKAMQTGKNGRS